MSWYVYFLKSRKKRWYYVGSSNRIEERIREHNLGKVLSTKSYRPLQFVYKIEFTSEKDARMYERKLKRKRREKEKIINKIESIYIT